MQSDSQDTSSNNIFSADNSNLLSTGAMLKMFLKLALPAIVTNLMTIGTLLINSLFAGHLNDPVKLAAVGLCNIMCNIMILAIMFGLNAA